MIRPLFLTLILSACNAPGPHFEGVPATRVQVEEMVFDVRVRGDLAEAMRLSTQWAPRLAGVKGPAALAMAHVSGCRVLEVRGDQALVLGLLDCGDGGARRRHLPVLTEYDCYQTDTWKSRGLNQRTRVFDCDPVL